MKLPGKLVEIQQLENEERMEIINTVSNRLRLIRLEKNKFLPGGVIDALKAVTEGLDSFVKSSRWLIPIKDNPISGKMGTEP